MRGEEEGMCCPTKISRAIHLPAWPRALWCAAQKSRPSLLQRSIGDVLAIRQNVGRHLDEWALRRADPKGENVSRCEESE